MKNQALPTRVTISLRALELGGRTHNKRFSLRDTHRNSF
jgi:hypothetical protein